MAPDENREGFGQRYGVTILTIVIAALLVLVCIVQVKT